MKVWPIDPLVPRNLRLEVPEKLPQGFSMATSSSFIEERAEADLTAADVDDYLELMVGDESFPNLSSQS